MITFIVPGPPVGKGRPKFFRRGNFTGTYTPEKTTNYDSLVKTAYRLIHCGNPSEEAIKVHIAAYFPIPASAPKHFKIEASTEEKPVVKKPDADNIIKIVLDALNQIAWRDDSQVFDVQCVKLYSQNPRVVVKIEEVHEEAF